MLTRLVIRNFKRFHDVDIELGEAVVLIGPNNSGKSTALQALPLWEIGVKRWIEKRGGPKTPTKRPGVAINRKDLIAIPVPNAKLLWRDLHVRNVERAGNTETSFVSQKTQNVTIDVMVEGFTKDQAWTCGMEFDYANEESLYCRPLRMEVSGEHQRMSVPLEAGQVQIAFLPPMSGLAATEDKKEPGRINVLIGEGQTAQVLRNLCYLISSSGTNSPKWQSITRYIRDLFGVTLHEPTFIPERGEITMVYSEGGIELDLSCSGRGLQQTLLLLAHLYANPECILLLDEPDAHLEILRQRQIYNVLTDVASEQRSQIIAASHSEVVLNEAAGRDIVIAFVGRPHRVTDRKSQVAKALKEIGFEHYYQAEQMGWVLYLEGSTDLALLAAFAEKLGHPLQEHLKQVFVHYVGADTQAVSRHFHGLREAKPDLVGVALFDRRDKSLPPDLGPVGLTWQKKEIENYICSRNALLKYAEQGEPEELWAAKRRTIMEALVDDMTRALQSLNKPSPWSGDLKVTDLFLDPLFERYFKELQLPNLMRKSDYHRLAQHVSKDDLDPEVTEKLVAIHKIAKQAKPRKV